ncbi:MAG: glycosyl transferase, group 1 [Rhizobacter sp.]|nr:glycosyl transferase, group 1 [Rhizobacter sp.]
MRPDASVHFTVPGCGITLSAADEVVTYVARNLEPYRGFPTFMRCLPEVLKRRPGARILIVGGDSTSYGRALPNGQTYRQKMLDELGDSLDTSRVHFLGKVPYASFLAILQISSAHVYLTYPFVLSWSMMEAMAAGCVLVASRTAPVTEMICDGENGVLVDFFSPPQVANAVVEVLANPQDHAALRANARRLIVEQFDLKRICLPAQLNLVERLTR